MGYFWKLRQYTDIQKCNVPKKIQVSAWVCGGCYSSCMKFYESKKEVIKGIHNTITRMLESG